MHKYIVHPYIKDKKKKNIALTIYYKTLKSMTVLPRYSSYIASRGEFKTVFSPHKAPWNKDRQVSVTHWRTGLKCREIKM